MKDEEKNAKGKVGNDWMVESGDNRVNKGSRIHAPALRAGGFKQFGR